MQIKRVHNVVAFDFDGTIAYSTYPTIRGIIPGAKETINKFQDNGGIAILWTCREGVDLADAVNFCRYNGIFFDEINENIPERRVTSRKIWADLYVDDLSVGGVDWRVVNRILNGEW